MAATPKSRAFKESELADEAEVERLETEPQEAAAPVAEPAEAPAPAEAAEEAAPKPHEESVNWDRFQEVNTAKNALEKEVAELREFRARLDERQRIIKEANDQVARQQEQQRRAAERPDPGLDPVGAELFDHRQRAVQYESQLQNLQSQLNSLGQNVQTNQEQTQFSNWVTNEANSYHQTDPHYFNAAKYAADKRINFWRQIAPNAPAGLAEKIVEGESVMIARLAQQYGGRFAPAVVQLAKDWGFAPVPQQPQMNGNGAARRPATPQQQRLEQVRNGQRVQGLGGVPAGGNAQTTSAYRNFSAADIANMPEREFMRAMANPQTAADLRYAMARAEGLDDGGGDVNW